MFLIHRWMREGSIKGSLLDRGRLPDPRLHLSRSVQLGPINLTFCASSLSSSASLVPEPHLPLWFGISRMSRTENPVLADMTRAERGQKWRKFRDLPRLRWRRLRRVPVHQGGRGGAVGAAPAPPPLLKVRGRVQEGPGGSSAAGKRRRVGGGDAFNDGGLNPQIIHTLTGF